MSDLSVFADPFSTDFERAYPPRQIMLMGEVHEYRPSSGRSTPEEKQRFAAVMEVALARSAELGRQSAAWHEAARQRGLARLAARNG